MKDEEYKRYIDARAGTEIEAIQRRKNREAWELRKATEVLVVKKPTIWKRMASYLDWRPATQASFGKLPTLKDYELTPTDPKK